MKKWYIPLLVLILVVLSLLYFTLLPTGLLSLSPENSVNAPVKEVVSAVFALLGGLLIVGVAALFILISHDKKIL